MEDEGNSDMLVVTTKAGLLEVSTYNEVLEVDICVEARSQC